MCTVLSVSLTAEVIVVRAERVGAMTMPGRINRNELVTSKIGLHLKEGESLSGIAPCNGYSAKEPAANNLLRQVVLSNRLEQKSSVIPIRSNNRYGAGMKFNVSRPRVRMNVAVFSEITDPTRGGVGGRRRRASSVERLVS